MEKSCLMIFYNVSFCLPQKTTTTTSNFEMTRGWVNKSEMYEAHSNALLLLLQKDHNVLFTPSLILQFNFQVSPSIYNISQIFHLSPTSFDTWCIRILKSTFQKKVNFHPRNKRGKVFRIICDFPRERAVGAAFSLALQSSLKVNSCYSSMPPLSLIKDVMKPGKPACCCLATAPEAAVSKRMDKGLFPPPS